MQVIAFPFEAIMGRCSYTKLPKEWYKLLADSRCTKPITKRMLRSSPADLQLLHLLWAHHLHRKQPPVRSIWIITPKIKIELHLQKLLTEREKHSTYGWQECCFCYFFFLSFPCFIFFPFLLSLSITWKNNLFTTIQKHFRLKCRGTLLLGFLQFKHFRKWNSFVSQIHCVQFFEKYSHIHVNKKRLNSF